MRSGTGVLVTRASDQAGALLSKFDIPGVQLVPFPLLRIESLELDHSAKDRVLNIDAYDKVIFVSRNAVRYGMSHIDRYWPQFPVSVQWFAVGSGTGRDLRSRGLDALVPDDPATEGLLAMSELQDLGSQRVLIVRGRTGREKLSRVLKERGAKTDYLEAYQRLPENWSSADLLGVTGQYDVCIALITSGTALENLDRLIVEQRQRQSIKLILPSQRLIELANILGYTELTLSAGATDELMISGLRQLLEKK
jgi:uroporphyrinogen-III synthase